MFSGDEDLSTVWSKPSDRMVPAPRAVTWLGRTAPAHFLLRALRWTWPLPVDSVAIMRNIADNPGLDPALMQLHDNTFVPSVDPVVSSVYKFAAVAAKAEPTAAGGFVVRISERAHGDTPADDVYVSLRGLRRNGGASVRQEYVVFNAPAAARRDEPEESTLSRWRWPLGIFGTPIASLWAAEALGYFG
jgi:hypothetical protein